MKKPLRITLLIAAVATIVAVTQEGEESEVRADVLNTQNWEPTTIDVIQERGRAWWPKKLDGVALCSPSDKERPRGGIRGTQEMTREEVIEARYQKIDDLLANYEHAKNGSLKGKRNLVAEKVRDEVYQLKLAGEDVFSRYEKSGGDVHRNLASHIMGIDDVRMIPMLSAPAGVNDYVTGRPLRVGHIMLGGCVVALPDEPQRAIAYLVNGNMNNLGVGDLNELLNSDIASVFQAKYRGAEDFAIASNFDSGSAKGHSYIHLHTFAGHSSAHILNTFFHELKHVHAEDRARIMVELPNARDYYRNNLETEVRGVLYGTAKVGQFLYREQGEGAFVQYIENVISHHSSESLKETRDAARLRDALMSNNATKRFIESLESKRLTNNFGHEDTCQSLLRRERRTQDAVDECLLRIKDPYDAVGALEIFKEMVTDKEINLKTISDARLDLLVNRVVSTAMLRVE